MQRWLRMYAAIQGYPPDRIRMWVWGVDIPNSPPQGNSVVVGTLAYYLNGSHLTPELNYGTETPDPEPGSCPDESNPSEVGNPTNAHIGNKLHSERITACSGEDGLRLELFYNSATAVAGAFGANWSANYFQKLEPYLNNATTPSVVAYRPDGRIVTFQRIGGLWKPASPITARIAPVSDGWSYTTASGTVEYYTSAGKLTKVESLDGRRHLLAYDGAGRLSLVTSPFGRTLAFGYDTRGRVNQITDPAGRLYGITYADPSNNLSLVTYPDTTTKHFLYEAPSYVNAMTGIEDENHDRYATYAYDPVTGRVTSTEHTGGVNRVDLARNADGSTTVTDAQGMARTYRNQSFQGVARTTLIEGPPCDWCTEYPARTPDQYGFLQAATNWNGKLTTYLRQDPAGRSTSTSGNTVFTHYNVNAQYLRNIGITLPGGF